MPAHQIEYAELYADDRQLAVEFLVSSFGFTQVAEARDRGKVSSLLRQGDVQLIVSSGPATGEFLKAGGDGIADIALTCDNVSTTRDAAVAAGAAVIDSAPNYPVVSGFGRVCHTLLPLDDPSRHRLPPGRAWGTSEDAGPRPGGRIRQLDHVAVCLEAGTLDEYVDFYSAGFGLARYSSEYITIGGQAMDSIVVRSPSGGITYTFLAPDPAKDSGQIDAFLERNDGPGVQHLAFLVDDITSSVYEFRDRGVEFLSTPDTYYDMLIERLPGLRADTAALRATGVLADRDEWGDLLQLFTRSPYPRNTLFYELIQRRGARGFGSANIRALYEAVERDLLAAE